MGSSSIRASLSASLSSGTCFAKRLRTFALRMFGIRLCLWAALIMMANPYGLRIREKLLEHLIFRARVCICVCVEILDAKPKPVVFHPKLIYCTISNSIRIEDIAFYFPQCMNRIAAVSLVRTADTQVRRPPMV